MLLTIYYILYILYTILYYTAWVRCVCREPEFKVIIFRPSGTATRLPYVATVPLVLILAAKMWRFEKVCAQSHAFYNSKLSEDMNTDDHNIFWINLQSYTLHQISIYNWYCILLIPGNKSPLSLNGILWQPGCRCRSLRSSQGICEKYAIRLGMETENIVRVRTQNSLRSPNFELSDNVVKLKWGKSQLFMLNQKGTRR